VRTFTAGERVAHLRITGRTEAEKRVRVKAETAGRVEALPVTKGAAVQKGEIVCRLDEGAREARVLQAQAALTQAELDHEAAAKLQTQGFAAATRVRALKAALDAASAALAQAELDLSRTRIAAPFDGLVEAHDAELGDFLNVGAPCATISTRDPILVVGQVSERDIAKLEPGMTGTATLVTGETVNARIRFISPTADPATRTFRVELKADNPQARLRDGVTAEIDLPLKPVRAHKLSPAYLTLDDAGNIGVRSVDAGGIVHFNPVTVLGNGAGEIWVADLPETIDVIVTGQEYVAAGERVTPVRAEAEDEAGS
ncbi:MAG TPA: efflux RND transporter periplasmic adaptor subunit, partial [Hyphomicrobiales bacterium]|nr:efflux RND transporter periplasmic adaptor subunit [Hyphomicrobiales bacterium]